MAYDPKVVYRNLNIVERNVVDALNDLRSLFVNVISDGQWHDIWELNGVTSDARMKAFESAWGMISIPENGFTCFDAEGCWATSSTRLEQIRNLKLVAELSSCDPFGDFVNWRAYPVQVPDPC